MCSAKAILGRADRAQAEAIERNGETRWLGRMQSEPGFGPKDRIDHLLVEWTSFTESANP